MDCLDEETILAFCRGGLAETTRSRAQEHLGTCDECRQLVSAVARSSFVDLAPVSRDIAGEPAPLLRARPDPAMAATTPVGISAHPPSSPVQPGDILAGKFQIERVLGEGGMGIVVAARHTQLDQRVALKFLLPAACEVPGAVARFLREGKAAASITSEHVARVMDTGVLADGAPYLVMEYLEGSDLGAFVQARGALPAADAIEYVLQACEAIAEAHELGVVHRDLKPANLFLARRADGSPLVKVLDFGISKVAGAGSRSQLTSASVLMGSPRYMSPEQMVSAKDVDARTDVWALGVILYELVTGKAVWHADTLQGLCAMIASAPAPRLRAAVPSAPAILEDVIERCLAKRVEDRMASIAALAQALEAVAPPSARTSIERIVRLGRKDRVAYVAPSAAAAAAPASRVAIGLGIVVAILLVAGVVMNARLSRRTVASPMALPAASSVAPTPNILAAAPTPAPAPAPAPTIAASPAPTIAASLAPTLARAPVPSVAPMLAGKRAARAAAVPPLPSPASALPAASASAPPATNRALSDRK